MVSGPLNFPDFLLVSCNPARKLIGAHPFRIIITGIFKTFSHALPVFYPFGAARPSVNGRQYFEMFTIFIGIIGIFRAYHLLMQFLSGTYADDLEFSIRSDNFGKLCHFHRWNFFNVDFAAFHIIKGVPDQLHTFL